MVLRLCSSLWHQGSQGDAIRRVGLAFFVSLLFQPHAAQSPPQSSTSRSKSINVSIAQQDDPSRIIVPKFIARLLSAHGNNASIPSGRSASLSTPSIFPDYYGQVISRLSLNLLLDLDELEKTMFKVE
jgi:hypothetical protein